MTELVICIHKGAGDAAQLAAWRRLWAILLAECSEDRKAAKGAPTIWPEAGEGNDEK